MKSIFLKVEQIWGETALKIFEKYGTKAAISDYAIFTGGFVNNDYYTSEGNSLENRCGAYWSASPSASTSVRAVYYDGDEDWVSRPT